jgi:hypothetical protein
VTISIDAYDFARNRFLSKPSIVRVEHYPIGLVLDNFTCIDHLDLFCLVGEDWTLEFNTETGVSGAAVLVPNACALTPPLHVARKNFSRNWEPASHD